MYISLRFFRALYDQIRVKEENLIDFSMNTSHIKGKNTLLNTFFSFTLRIFLYLSHYEDNDNKVFIKLGDSNERR